MGRADADCVLLAAGLSTRMGRWKMVLPYGDSTVIETAVTRALSAVRRVILVTGFRANELARMFADDPGVFSVYNREYRRGMFSSVRSGAAAVTSKRFFVLPADMPGILPATFTKLFAARRAPVVRPVYKGKSGHPVLLDERVRKAVLAEPEDSNLKDVLGRFSSAELPVEDENILYDIDTTEDYRARRL